ncbi:MAG: AAA family ATPase [Methanomassiliicoccales archaeon]|nr:AAA family ATPase [Methanomassiliicoccales archaeon]
MSDRPKLRPPFIGREDQLEKMMARLAFALAGQGEVILISGEAGSGKTRLAEEFQQLASNTRCACVSSTCLPGQPAYAPFRQALASLASLDPAIAAMPSFHVFCRAEGGNGQGLMDGAKEEGSLFAAQELVRGASARLPLVVRIDDLQLADPRTIQMLHFLAREVINERALIVCTYSDDELFDRNERPHPLIEATRIMKREGLCEEIPLAPLTERQLAEALNGLLEKELEGQALSLLYRESGGNPEIAVELALEALRSGALILGEDRATMASWRTLGAPPALREWIGRKLEALPEDQLRLLECASLFGECFDAELLSLALGMQRLETLELLDAAVREYRLYVEAGDRYLFRWGVVRRVAMERIPASKAAELRKAIDRARSSRDNPD